MKPTLAKILSALPAVAGGIMLLARYVMPAESPWFTPLSIAGTVLLTAVLIYHMHRNRCPYCGASTFGSFQKHTEVEPIYCSRCTRYIR
jgi:hypothetical protein